MSCEGNNHLVLTVTIALKAFPSREGGKGDSFGKVSVQKQVYI